MSSSSILLAGRAPISCLEAIILVAATASTYKSGSLLHVPASRWPSPSMHVDSFATSKFVYGVSIVATSLILPRRDARLHLDGMYLVSKSFSTGASLMLWCSSIEVTQCCPAALVLSRASTMRERSEFLENMQPVMNHNCLQRGT